MDKSRLAANALTWGDWLVAGVIMVIALSFTVTAYNYSLGTVARIGPGMMPFLIGIALFIAATCALVLPRREQLNPVALPIGRVAALLGGVIVWALTIDRFGLVPATVLLMLLSTLAYGPIRWVSTLTVIAATTAGCVLLFIYGFRLPFDIVSW